MNRNPFRAARACWLLALSLPIPAGGVMWLVMSATVSHHQCATAASKSGGQVIALFVLVLLPIIAVAAQARRSRTELAYVISPLFVVLLFGVALQFLVISAWWSGHGCAT